ncbi:uncharacterized protein LY89DRAFT_714494 [Mollisia scopiformis]|uniref:Uncharacterized protein n=1 Tax=Mollisia scopiformis TaxID=149040 RepID=A0A194XR45_MOLSC|nr:uncharacterized protein LY89DRAFT_714494 [Mollisia scopiformis]KUJ22760.1 hypothetical protein LY89DRAFT_714494 [Mollisia scopiformis]
MHTSPLALLLSLFLALTTAEPPPPISIIPVPSYIPTIAILPPSDPTTAPLPLTIIPEPDLMPISSNIMVDIPPVSTMIPADDATTMMAPLEMTSVVTDVVNGGGGTSTTTTTTIPGVATPTTTMPPTTTTSTTTQTSLVTPSPTGTKGNSTGPIETSGVEGRGFGEVKMVSLALVGVLGIFVFA